MTPQPSLSARVGQAVDDTVAAIGRRRGPVALLADDDEVRYIARKAARLALGMERNPDRAESEADEYEPGIRELEAEVTRLRDLAIRGRWLVSCALDVPQAEARAEQWIKDTVGMPTPQGW